MNGETIQTDPEWNDTSPLAFATVNNKDTLTQSQKKTPDRAEFEKAQIPKIEGLIEQDVSNMFRSLKFLPRMDF